MQTLIKKKQKNPDQVWTLRNVKWYIKDRDKQNILTWAIDTTIFQSHIHFMVSGAQSYLNLREINEIKVQYLI